MSAKKKNKKKNKSKKPRVEKINNVLTEKEMKEKDKERAEARQEKQNVPQETINKAEMNDTIKDFTQDHIISNIKDEDIKNEDSKVEKEAVDKKISTEEILEDIKKLDDVKDIEETKVVPTVGKDLIKIEEKEEEKPEYVKEMLAKKRRRMYIFICIVAFFLVILLLSTIFAIINSGNTTISKGVKIKEFDVSNLSVEDAKELITEGTNKELIPEIKIKYNDYEKSFSSNQIEFEYDIDKAIEEAYLVGKSGNIIENNYKILFSTLFGKKIDLEYNYNDDLFNTFIDEVNADIPGVVIEPSYYREGDELFVTKGIDGLSIDKNILKEDILKDLTNRNAVEMKDDSFSQSIDLKVNNKKADKIDMSKIYEEIHTEPKDAYYELEPYALYPDVDGVDLTIYVDEAQKQVESEDKDEYKFKLKITKAKKTVSDLGLEAFPYLITEFSTKYDASNINRSTNLKIAADKINGTVLMPGEEFSYNKVVGKRTVEEGYKDAKIYADGGVVDGLAGGICQISSTLYNAVLLANLEVTERHNHTYTTSYLPAGRDATVVWGAKDFKFVNSRTYPIKIEASVKSGIAEFKFHGIAEEKEYEIKIIPVTTSSIPFSVAYEDDPTLAPGQEVVKQGGHAGYRVTTYKEVRFNGTTISKDVITNDTYSPMRKIIRRGVGAAPTEGI